jgi:hypothetical protein
MTSKKDGKNEENDLRGFQEFIDSQKDEGHSAPRPASIGSRKKESNFNNLTFLTNDRSRLMRTKVLLNEKINFMSKFNQSEALLAHQESELIDLRQRIFEITDEPNSPYRKSMREIFDSFFNHIN